MSSYCFATTTQFSRYYSPRKRNLLGAPVSNENLSSMSLSKLSKISCYLIPLVLSHSHFLVILMSQHGSNLISVEKYKKPSMDLLHQALEIHSLMTAILPRFFSDNLVENSSDSKHFEKAILDCFERVIQITSLLLGNCLKFSRTSSERAVRFPLVFSPDIAVEIFSTLVTSFSKHFTAFQTPKNPQIFRRIGEDLVSYSFPRGGTYCPIISK